MYINSIELHNFRTFRSTKIQFLHPNLDFTEHRLPVPTLKNINLLLGNNGQGKTTLLKAIALACLGPAVSRVGIYPYRLIRRAANAAPLNQPPILELTPGAPQTWVENLKARLSASFTPHEQDHVPESFTSIESVVEIQQQGDLELLEWAHSEEKPWHPIYDNDSAALFFVGYGATRRVEQKANFDSSLRSSRMSMRAQRVQSLFEDSYSLVPLNQWLPDYRLKNKGRYTQIVNLMNRLMGKDHYQFTGDMENGEYLYELGNLRVPFPALSDGYRAYLGWIGDLLYHICMTCPKGKKLVDNCGIVMVDEIDLHLHPQWQMTVLPTLAAALPKIQFIVTSHSPLVVGSLEWSNIIVAKQENNGQASTLERIPSAVHGLDADQILLTDFFELESTRAAGKDRILKDLTMRARLGDAQAARKLLREMSSGKEAIK
jgi:predicted ATPase